MTEPECAAAVRSPKSMASPIVVGFN